MGPALVSVVMTNFNYGRFIAESVESIVAQTYRPLQLILVDDASEDDSRERIERLQQRHKSRFQGFTVVLLDENRGINGALNRAIAEVGGEATAVLDADDRFAPDYLERTAALLFAGSPSLGFVYTDCALIDDQGRSLGFGHSNAFDAELLREKSYIPGCGTTKTEALMAAMPLDESIEVATKVYRWRDIVAHGFVGLHIPEPLFFYRMHGANVSGIGRRIIADLNAGNQSAILSGYWQSHDPK
ncbi:MAG: glycosyltransferase [Nanoarchaeota archaeon]